MDRLSSSLPFPLRVRKLQSLSGITLSIYRNLALLPLEALNPHHGKRDGDGVDGGAAIVHK